MTDKSEISSLESFISNSLKEQIINLDLLPGTKLSEMKIAKLYGCSRAPVRGAFSELRAKGYVESRPQVGTFVSKINLNRVEEFRFVRESVEIAVLNLGIENNLFVSKLPLLQANVNEMILARNQNNLKRFTDLDVMFHNILYSAVGKPFVSKYCGDNDVHYARLRFMVTRDSASLDSTISEHQEMLKLISSKDSTGINDVVFRHLHNIYNFLDRKDSANEDMFDGSIL